MAQNQRKENNRACGNKHGYTERANDLQQRIHAMQEKIKESEEKVERAKNELLKWNDTNSNVCRYGLAITVLILALLFRRFFRRYR